MSELKLTDWMQEHLERYLKTNGAEGHLMDVTAYGGKPDTPTLLLTTTGRKSGKAITLPLIYGKDGANYVVVGSKGGAPAHPAWYLNLTALPKVDVQVMDRKFHAVARTASGTERQRLWQQMADLYPPYNDFQKLTARELPVVVLEPMTV